MAPSDTDKLAEKVGDAILSGHPDGPVTSPDMKTGSRKRISGFRSDVRRGRVREPEASLRRRPCGLDRHRGGISGFDPQGGDSIYWKA